MLEALLRDLYWSLGGRPLSDPFCLQFYVMSTT